ncbi:hypothetical protein CBW65_03970 [Tumebacillus avium]|uniref:Uncharacterized protein n=1 Tax=Tumebacillus avium TaxID=1903704 RepID=A0A1Y0ILR9_9BACL|nr:hypothetical protein [Tumebacillus avium]ARU60313.1 hypothetical protein CBW65_03970 [Tumebacillus avium]
MKKALTLSIILTITSFWIAQPAMAATSLSYYEFTWPDNYHHSYSNTKFSNTDGTVVVNGWQTNDRQGAQNVYSVVVYGSFSDDYLGNAATVTGNYSQTGTWYSAVITNVPSGSGYQIRIDNMVYGVNKGAGNAY